MCSLSSMHSYNDCVVKITVITEVVLLLWYIELRAESIRCVCACACACACICVCVCRRERGERERESIRGECVREAEKERDEPVPILAL